MSKFNTHIRCSYARPWPAAALSDGPRIKPAYHKCTSYHLPQWCMWIKRLLHCAGTPWAGRQVRFTQRPTSVIKEKPAEELQPKRPLSALRKLGGAATGLGGTKYLHQQGLPTGLRPLRQGKILIVDKSYDSYWAPKRKPLKAAFAE